jgi:hypothetical protein
VGFTVFQKSSAPLARIPSVTIQKKGLLSLNRAAHALIGSPEFVELLWDEERHVIGLRATEETNPNAYPARPQSAKADKGPILVAGTTFTQFYKIDTAESRRWVPTVEDGDILAIDLSRPGQPVTSNRHGVGANGSGGGDPAD